MKIKRIGKSGNQNRGRNLENKPGLDSRKVGAVMIVSAPGKWYLTNRTPA
jgi:hypothetical protein